MTGTPPKKQLRSVLKERRAAIPPDEAADAAFRIGAHLQPLLTGASRVAAFSSTQNEVDLTDLYLEFLPGADPRLCFPRVVGPGAMEFADVASLRDLQPGAFGIAEPVGPAVALEEIDLFLIPGVGFDRRGGRLGFGGGFYDRALGRRLEVGGKVPLFVGVGYSCQVLDTHLPVDVWDVRLHRLVTEEGVLDVSER